VQRVDCSLLGTISLQISAKLTIFRCTGIANKDTAAHGNAVFLLPTVTARKTALQ
jgi:hypothetical protein